MDGNASVAEAPLGEGFSVGVAPDLVASGLTRGEISPWGCPRKSGKQRAVDTLHLIVVVVVAILGQVEVGNT